VKGVSNLSAEKMHSSSYSFDIINVLHLATDSLRFRVYEGGPI